MQEFIKELLKEHHYKAQHLLEKYKGKPACSLSSEETMLLAIVNGEEMNHETNRKDDGSYTLTMTTRYKMSAIWDGDRFIIARAAKE